MLEAMFTPGTDQFGGMLLIVVPSLVWALTWFPKNKTFGE